MPCWTRWPIRACSRRRRYRATTSPACGRRPGVCTRCTSSSWRTGGAWRGAGVYCLNEAGHARVTPFPDVISDDGFVHRSFAPGEREVTTGASSVVRPTTTFGASLRRRVRVRQGNQQLDDMGPPSLRADCDRLAGRARAHVGASARSTRAGTSPCGVRIARRSGGERCAGARCRGAPTRRADRRRRTRTSPTESRCRLAPGRGYRLAIASGTGALTAVIDLVRPAIRSLKISEPREVRAQLTDTDELGPQHGFPRVLERASPACARAATSRPPSSAPADRQELHAGQTASAGSIGKCRFGV